MVYINALHVVWVADLLQVSESVVVAAAAAVMAAAVVDDPAATTLYTAVAAIFAVVWSVVISVLGAVVAAAVLEIEVSEGGLLAEGAEPSQWFALSVHRWDAAPSDSTSLQDASNFGHSCHLLFGGMPALR